jgi:N-methylhydantoinase A/oxoprolinase/acetone carboxylase beta subunit
VKYARVGGHETYVSSLDVRVLGIAGGSLVRVADGKLVDVGPRSAHIAGLAYSAFASPDVFDGATVELFQPGPGEAADHVAVRGKDGARYAITTTCAANALGYAKPGMHAFGNPDAARAAMTPLAAMLGCSIDEAARRILERATDKVIPVVEQLVAEYGLDHDQSMLVGEGGGAGALMPFAAERLGLRHVISPDAEVISSIGVALALVREVVERVIADPQPEDLRAIRREALDAVVGASEMRARSHRKRLGEAEACAVAAQSMGVPVGATRLAAATDGMHVIQATMRDPDERHPVRAIDLEGAIRIQRGNATVRRAHASDAPAVLQALWDGARGEMFLVLGAHVIDLSGIASRDQALAVARTELEGVTRDATVVFIAVPHATADRHETSF